jgi:hypothetical protein
MICKRKGKWELASCVAVGKPWRLAICTSLASCVTVNELHTVGKPCGSGQSVWELASSVPPTSYIPWANCVAVGRLYAAGELCGSGQAVWQRASLGVFGCSFGIRHGVGADVTVPPRRSWPALAKHRPDFNERSFHEPFEDGSSTQWPKTLLKMNYASTVATPAKFF